MTKIVLILQIDKSFIIIYFKSLVLVCKKLKILSIKISIISKKLTQFNFTINL